MGGEEVGLEEHNGLVPFHSTVTTSDIQQAESVPREPGGLNTLLHVWKISVLYKLILHDRTISHYFTALWNQLLGET